MTVDENIKMVKFQKDAISKVLEESKEKEYNKNVKNHYYTSPIRCETGNNNNIFSHNKLRINSDDLELSNGDIGNNIANFNILGLNNQSVRLS